jgi:phosphomannomutase/phosphoglucomutase
MMLPKPRSDLLPNRPDYECFPLVHTSGFREYDARWLIDKEINLLGVRAVGLGLGTLLHELGVRPHVVTGHDYRSYSMAVKDALTVGLMASGCTVYDIGLALTPTAYFAQFDLDVPGLAMVTASHNDNGWTGIKMASERPLTFGPEKMAALRDIVLSGRWKERAGGCLHHIDGMAERYMQDLVAANVLSRKLKVVAACGNGTAGAFAPRVLAAVGCEVIPLACELDYTFPRYNPNPEDMAMLRDMSEAVKRHGADVALGFDGDGDRCGVVDNEGRAIFADKVGVLLARDISARRPAAKLVVDVKSTGLFATDPVLLANGAVTEYWKTGHSYIKQRTGDIGAIAGFEKSGHYFFREPLGRGYDDGLAAALAICRMLDRAGSKSMAELHNGLPRTWSTPTMSPYCADESKYAVVDRVTAHYRALRDRGACIAGRKIADLVTVNGVRVQLDDGSWGLVRASSNKPELVVVCESPVCEATMRAVFTDIDNHLATYSEIGAYNQKI